ncbi:hypothetical protein [uncultured Thiodictyon sp.]|uniref:hypothetical protein n=1 Tax=uncultured Thiodictyon sp. TaxID=1846217 RepID=UPI0025E4AE10|nr:hypothetical protein [uncultured Thiodictyon sp.]
MRKEITLDLDGTGGKRMATVRELQVRDVRLVLDRVQAITGAETELPILALVQKYLPDLHALAKGSLALPKGTTLEELSLSESRLLAEAWWELHADFFGPIVAFAKTHLPTLMAGAGGISTAPVSPVSSGGTVGSGAMDGHSSSRSSIG